MIKKRSIKIAGHATSVSLEEEFWSSLNDIAHSRNQSLAQLVGDIDTTQRNGGLSSRLRLFVLDYYKRDITK
ncbi:ribbon-helix-helix domain-containing protein [Alphaproteobacteria bacterium]|jgi:predicted DNA-binding ribbon-helix-helix protein|nr:ribbon-helix-helix domain-containing protein [Alphaproteobacteria bacterium]